MGICINWEKARRDRSIPGAEPPEPEEDQA